MNQKQQVLSYLKRHRKSGITQMDATNKLGCMRLSERVRELEFAGNEIARVPEKTINRNGHVCRYMRYFLIKSA